MFLQPFLINYVIEHPVWVIVKSDPEVAPFIKLSVECFPGKAKYGGIATPAALPQPRMVIVSDFPAFTAWGCALAEPKIEDGLWSGETPFSSTIPRVNIR